jgi:signal transduction histidine kinase/ligand-binding sensor domain-containing protein
MKCARGEVKLEVSVSMRYLLAIILSILISLSGAFAQSGEAGVPFISNFTPKQYNANTQNWAVVQDKRGVMYFGNNKGVLEYDGVNWRLIPVSNHSIVRSLAIDSTGTIYVGAVGEFGYLAPDKSGALRYISLVSHIPEAESLFSDVWTTLVKGDEVYFQSFYKLYRYKNGAIKSWNLLNSYHRSFIVYDKLYLREEGKGLMVMENDSLLRVKDGGLFAGEAVSAMLPFKGEIIIGTRTQGLFLLNPEKGAVRPFKTKANGFLKKNQPYHGALLGNGSYAFSTVQDGVIVIDREGEPVIRLGQETGLLSKSVYYLYPDRNGALWMGLANGISRVEVLSPINIFDKILGLDGGIISVTRFKGTLYIGTHQGVFFLNKENHFEQVQGIETQAWQMEVFRDPESREEERLLVASTGGVFEISGNQSTLVLSGRSGAVKTSLSDPYRVFIGFNGYVGSIRLAKGAWKTEAVLEINNDEYRSIAEDKRGNLWLGSMFSGCFKIKIKDWEAFIKGDKINILDSLKTYKTEKGLPTSNWNYFYRVQDELLVTGQKGIYRYNPERDFFEKDKKTNAAFRNEERWFYYLNEDVEGNLWFDSDKGKGVLLKKEGIYELSENSLKRIIVSPENQVTSYIDADGMVWFGTPDGLFRYDSHNEKDYTTAFNALIRKVAVEGDSVIFNGAYFSEAAESASLKAAVGFKQPNALRQQLDYSKNSFSFNFAAPEYQNESSNQFSYFLEGYDHSWSAWSRETKKEYTNLYEGTYVFKVKARNFYETESKEASFAFTVLPPWYRTPLAYLAYFTCLFGFILVVTRGYSARLKKDNLRLEETIQTRTAEIHAQKEKIEKQKNEVEKSYRNVTTLSQLGQDITATLEFKGIIQTLYVGINTLMEVSSFGVGVFEAANKSLNFSCAFEEGEELPPFSIQLGRTDNLAAWSFNNRKEVFINDLEKEFHTYLPELPHKPPAGDRLSQSVIYVPLKIKEKIIGVITVQNFEKHAYQPYHLDIIRTLAAYTAIALDNSYAYLRVNEINEELSTTLEHLKHTQTQLVQSEKMASLGQLTAGVAHEINNPINFVSAGIDSLDANYTDLQELLKKLSCLKAGEDNAVLLQEVEQLKKEIELDYLLEEIPQLLRSIKTGAQRTTEIVKSLKNFTRLDEENLKPANLHEGLDSTLVILRNQLSEKVKIVKEYDETVPPVQCYPGQINQVFMNILNNAIQAIEGEGIIYISTRLQQEHVLIRIKDTGKGMSQEVMNRIFEPFFTTKDVGEGTGLGLSISYGILEKHKGNITVNSVAGNGTEFTIQLPLNLS